MTKHRYIVGVGWVPHDQLKGKPHEKRSKLGVPDFAVDKDRLFVSRSQPRCTKDADGQWVKPHGVEHVNEVGQPVFTGRKEIREYCAGASDNDSVEVSYGTD